MIREVGKRLLKGSISLNDMSMPVKIFEPRSYLEKLADPWIYPEFLDRAALAVRRYFLRFPFPPGAPLPLGRFDIPPISVIAQTSTRRIYLKHGA